MESTSLLQKGMQIFDGTVLNKANLRKSVRTYKAKKEQPPVRQGIYLPNVAQAIKLHKQAKEFMSKRLADLEGADDLWSLKKTPGTTCRLPLPDSPSLWLLSDLGFVMQTLPDSSSAHSYIGYTLEFNWRNLSPPFAKNP